MTHPHTIPLTLNYNFRKTIQSLRKFANDSRGTFQKVSEDTPRHLASLKKNIVRDSFYSRSRIEYKDSVLVDS